ncbi:hypothetical protein Syn7502_02476 [Synechococcus sp. PCC 7502]|uniref:hypothetical protein n=1 Tax=Synechococcus sp. PCC 7502 TaxID=1173263 RepID=UPI00029FBFED|nr:hypothetical protein [Synechococcus sp. PCC 7502]AFY74455.1 hypothetical protein Syn7502_02476 [Synechococcus sp. PCC 7502]
MSKIIDGEGLEEQRSGITWYEDSSDPVIRDPALSQASSVWRGANEISFKLLRCVEAMRDLSKSMESLSKLDDPNTDKRLVKQLSSPLYSLATGIKDMFNELESNVKNYIEIDPQQLKFLINKKERFLANVPLDNKSDLRIVRDKIDSHIDKVAVNEPEEYWKKVDLRSFLEWIGICLVEVFELLYLDVYSWERESGHPEIWSLMMVDEKLVDFYMQNGEPESIVNVTLVKSPKYGVMREIETFASLFNKVASKCEGMSLIEIIENKTL